MQESLLNVSAVLPVQRNSIAVQISASQDSSDHHKTLNFSLKAFNHLSKTYPHQNPCVTFHAVGWYILST